MISLKIYSLSYTTQICKVLDAGIDPFDTACKDLMNTMTGAIAPLDVLLMLGIRSLMIS